MSRVPRTGLASLLLLAAGAPGCAGAAGGRPPLESLGPREFLEEAARRSAAQARLGREALVERADVRAFVKRTMEDHARIERDALEVLRETQADAPPGAEPAQGEAASSETAHEDCRFEADYLACVISDHEDLIAAYEERSRSGAHPAVTSFAERSVPVLQERLEEARALRLQIVSARAQPFLPPPTLPPARFMIVR